MLCVYSDVRDCLHLVVHGDKLAEGQLEQLRKQLDQQTNAFRTTLSSLAQDQKLDFNSILNNVISHQRKQVQFSCVILFAGGVCYVQDDLHDQLLQKLMNRNRVTWKYQRRNSNTWTPFSSKDQVTIEKKSIAGEDCDLLIDGKVHYFSCATKTMQCAGETFDVTRFCEVPTYVRLFSFDIHCVSGAGHGLEERVGKSEG